jgi:hypothetical protein
MIFDESVITGIASGFGMQTTPPALLIAAVRIPSPLTTAHPLSME